MWPLMFVSLGPAEATHRGLVTTSPLGCDDGRSVDQLEGGPPGRTG
jgi:hypothetical protein